MQYSRTIPDDFLEQFARRINFQAQEGVTPSLADFQAAVSTWIDSNIDAHLVEISKAAQLAKVQPQIDALLQQASDAVTTEVAAVVAVPVDSKVLGISTSIAL